MSTAFPNPNVDHFVCFSVYALNHTFGRLYAPLLDRLGLTYAQYLAMVVLWEKDERTVGEIGARLALESNTLTPLLKRLEAAGLVTRQRSTRDERQVLIVLTPKGQSLAADAATIPACIADACGMDMRELEVVRATLTRLRQRIENGLRGDRAQTSADQPSPA